jgi:hypothetical protein
MTKYLMLLRILDQIRQEAQPAGFTSRYLASTREVDQINHERARAFIHLYLKVRFGILDFRDREHFITDGTYDGGIDGYYISSEEREIYIVQSKFRTSPSSFETRPISLEDLLAMDVARVLEGHEGDEAGNKYNGKILQFQREVRAIPDIGRYSYRLVLLANVEDLPPSKLARVVGGFPCEVINYEKCYDELVFPVVSGTYFNAADHVIHLDLSNKNAGSKISYTVGTQFGECDITVLFVPTIEIAQTFHKYKNSILKFNPRSYLQLEGQKVNEAIRATIFRQGQNEFALYNNGITMLSDETNLNERIGQRNKAQLNVRNPQIINGGQTAYTLSRIYSELTPEKAEAAFEGKEVLLKVITLNPGTMSHEDTKLRLIEAISEATNLQTAVFAADRYSNEPVNLQLQTLLFERHGLLYERKRGEFQDGLDSGYIDGRQIVERNFFFRILFAANGNIKRAVEKRMFAKLSKSGWSVPTPEQTNRFYFAFQCFQLLSPIGYLPKNEALELYAKLYILTSWFMPQDFASSRSAAQQAIDAFDFSWREFVAIHESGDSRFIKTRLNRLSGAVESHFNKQKWFRSGTFPDDAKQYFGALPSRST